MRALLAVAASLLTAAASAQTVSLSGSLGTKALLMIDGQPRTLAVGSTLQGVKLIAVSAHDATVEVGGKRINLRLGEAQISLGATGAVGAGVAGATRIVLSAGPGGHYIASGAINGHAVQFMVDTGATSVSLSQADARRMGIKFQNGPVAMASTANGKVPVHRVKLDAVRVGDVVVQGVEAVIMPGEMGHILLGNSFLSRFQMKTDNQVMTLERRF